MADHERWMRRALELAQRGQGSVSPNPMVGCVLIRNNHLIGEGWHEKYGGPHAEVNAVRSVSDPELVKGCTAYVSLEPCAHFGKTPPCSDLLIAAGVAEVFVGCSDPNPKVNGQGIARLKAAGIQVTCGILEGEALDLNRRFITSITKSRPWIMLKWAETADGYIARPDGDSKWISNTLSRQLVHRWRAEEDSILIGATTAITDNPKLTVRDWTGRNPVRVVLDPHGRVSGDLEILNDESATLIYTKHLAHQSGKTIWISVNAENNWLSEILADLHRRGIHSIIVEGGAVTLNHFIQSELWDEARIFISETIFGEGIRSPQISGQLIEETRSTGDRLRKLRRQAS